MSRELTPSSGSPREIERAEPLSGEVISPRPVKPQKIKVRKYGFLGAFLRPIGIAVALILLVWGGLGIGTTYYRGYQRHLEYSKLTHEDKSYLEVLLGMAGPALSTGETKFVYRDIDGKVHRVVVATSAVDRFVNETLVILDNERDKIAADAKAEMDKAFDKAFADREQAIGDYADWFFEWKRSYAILGETISATAQRMVQLGRYESLREAVEHDVNDYFMKNYTERVLKPEVRDEKISAAMEQIVRKAHVRFRDVVARTDERLQEFLAAQSRVLEELPPDDPATRTHLDWDARKWKAPLYAANDMAFDGLVGVGTIAAGGTVGAVMPVVARAVASTFASLSRSIVASMGGRIALAEGGAAVGTALGPAGTVVGTVGGIAVGAGIDYFMSKRREKQNRAEFIDANEKALDLTIDQWKQKFGGSLDSAFQRWFDDARAGTILSRQKRPLPKLEGGRKNTPTS